MAGKRLAASLRERFAEDLPRLSAESFELANRLCDTCRTIHSVWPYLRLTRMVGAAEAGRTALETVLGKLFASGRRRLLIAGAADTGILAIAAQAGADHRAEIVVLDRCATPLELCRRYAQQWSLPIETVHEDLKDLSATDRFDVIIAHSLLQCVAPEHRALVLPRLARSLRKDGRLVHIFNTAGRIAGDIVPEYRSNYADWVLAELARRKVPFPEPEPAFRKRLEQYAELRRSWEGTFRDYPEVESMMQAAGLRAEEVMEIDLPLSAPYRQFVTKIAKRRYLVIAAPQQAV